MIEATYYVVHRRGTPGDWEWRCDNYAILQYAMARSLAVFYRGTARPAYIGKWATGHPLPDCPTTYDDPRGCEALAEEDAP